MVTHIHKAHMIAYPYQCPLCPHYSGEKRWHLSAHIRTKHEKNNQEGENKSSANMSKKNTEKVGDVGENIPGGGQ